MAWYRDCKLVNDGDEYIAEIYLDINDTEFSEEFLNNLKISVLSLDAQIKKLIAEKFKGIKVGAARIMIGTLVIAAMPMVSLPDVSAAAAQAAGTIAFQSRGSVTASKLNVRTGPSTGYSIMHVLWQGNNVSIIAASGDWFQIRLSDGRVGWVSKAYIRQTVVNAGSVNASKLNVRTGPSTGYAIMHVLWQGNRVNITGESGSWYQIRLSDGREGFVSKAYIQTGSVRQDKINRIISTAKSLIGTPYVWGGESPAEGGFDCSGFTYYVFLQAGYTLNRVSADQARQGTAISRANIQPGDLLFQDINGSGTVSHVGIYIGDGIMIHCPKPGDRVKYTDITTSYWESRFKTARRIF